MTAKKICSARGRPRCFDVDRAVEIAMTLFHERGYDGVGVAELAKAIGVNPPSLYAAFGSKLGLFERAVARYTQERGGFIVDLLEQGQEPEQAVRQLFRKAGEAFSANRQCLGCLVMDGTRNSVDPEARAVTDALRDETRNAVIRWLEDKDVPNAATLADALMIGLAGLSAAARDGMSKDALCTAANMLADGLASRLELAARAEN